MPCIEPQSRLQSAKSNYNFRGAKDTDWELIITDFVQPTVKHKRILTSVLSV